MLVLILVVLVAVGLASTTAMTVLYVLSRRRVQRDEIRLTVTRKQVAAERKERDRVEAIVRKRQEWAELLFNNTQDLVFVFTVTPSGLPGPFTQANDVACRRLGHSREKLMTMTPLDIEEAPVPSSTLGYTRSELALMSDDEIMERQNITSTARRLVSRILEQKQVLYERVYITRTGRRFPVEISAIRFDFMEEPTIMLTAHDITERRRIHRALQESEQRFQDFFAHSPIGVAMYDAERKLINVNQSCIRMFGTPDQDEFGRFDIFNNPYLSEEVRQTLARGENIAYEATVDFDEIRRQGLFVTGRSGKAHFDLLIHNMGLDQEYRPKGYLAQVQDITRRREAETALISSEKQLRQAQKMEAIGTLAGGIAHDFNNILTPIMGYTEMVIQSQTMGNAEQSGDYLKEVLRASHRAKELVNQILTFSRQAEQEGQPIHVVTIVKEVLRQVQATLPQGIQVKRVVKADADVVLAEPTQIHQVVLNLCTNAIHAMRQSDGVLEISLSNFVLGPRSQRKYQHLHPGRYLRMSVRDTGVGMDALTVERIFEPFFTTKASGEGTGMGLAVVHGIVSSLKGTITVETEVGVGSTFHVILPLVDQEEIEAEEESSQAPRGSECILFVDDEKDIVKMEAHMLSSLGYEPVVATNGAEGLRLFQMNPDQFDLVITDQVMPEMTGVEMSKAILSIRPDIPIILCTGFSEAVSPQLAKAIGIREFMLKPIAMRTLADTIRSVLSVRPGPLHVGAPIAAVRRTPTRHGDETDL